MGKGLLWRGPGNIHGFVLGGNSYQQGWATAQTPNEAPVSNINFNYVEPHF